MRYLIFDNMITGHHLEYIHHIYEAAVKMENDEFFFLTSKSFSQEKDKLCWTSSDNVSVIFLSDEEQYKCDNKNLLLAAWYKSIVIKKHVERYSIDNVILVMIMLVMPFLPLLLPNKIRISGILYRIYFYENMAYIRTLFEKIRYWIMSKCSNVYKVFVLNDKEMTCKLNSIYNTNKYVYLPDPVVIDDSNVRNIRSELRIKDTDKMYLHFGGLNQRKGTLEILQAVRMMSEAELNEKVFVFAGKVYDVMKKEFYTLVEEVKQKAKIIVFDEFCSYEHLNNLCYSCDYILIPYKNANQSSGVIGYACWYNKPVLGPMSGLLGRLIGDYEMGICIDSICAKNIRKGILMLNDVDEKSKRTNYVSEHSIVVFTNTILA